MSQRVNIDWYEHYTQYKKIAPLDQEHLVKQIRNDTPFLKMLTKYIHQGGTVLECGCGLARTAMSIASTGYHVSVLDHNQQLLVYVKKCAEQLGLNMQYIYGDFFELSQYVPENSFNCITHQGVLEHYDHADIVTILQQQLRVAPLIICSVPILTPFNTQYFQDNVYRNLWTEMTWQHIVCATFHMLESLTVRQRTDNLVFVIQRKYSSSL